MNVINRNFFRLLRSGAFNEKGSIEPMSAFKWNRLYQMVEAQSVTPVFTQGVNRHADDKGLNLPKELIGKVQSIINDKTVARHNIVNMKVHLANGFLNRRLGKVFHDERHSIDTSTETMNLLRIIIFNVDAMLNQGMSLDGIIQLGEYLRTKGDKVDFVKLDAWLTRLHMQDMAQLEGSILIAVFGFEQDEIPFVQKVEKDAYKLTLRSISYLAKDTAKEWHFRQNNAGFLQNNSAVLRRNLRRSIRYIGYAPLETISNFFSNFARSLQEIEE